MIHSNALTALSILRLLLEKSALSHGLHLLQSLEHDPVGLVARLDLEQLIHALKRNTLGLRNEEENERYGQNHQAGEEKVHSVAHGKEHLRREPRDDEIPEPVVGGCRRLAEGTSLLAEHFGVDDPGSAVPGWCVENGPQVEEEDRGNTAGRQLVRFTRGSACNLNVRADNPHADGTASGTDHKELGAAQMIDQVHQPDNGYNCFDDAEETSGEKASVCAGNADGLEDSGGVVVLRDLLAFSCED